MPGGDRSGPEGLGPMTGRRMGYCVGSNNPGFSFRGGFGRGRGFYGRRGGGFGYGFRGSGYGYQAYPETDLYNDKEAIENEIKTLKDQLSFMENKLSNLKKEKE